MERALTQIRVPKWLGRVSNVAAHKLPPGAAQVHENLRCQVPGQMDVRPGTAALTASTGTASITTPLNAYSYTLQNMIVFQDNGTILYGQTLS